MASICQNGMLKSEDVPDRQGNLGEEMKIKKLWKFMAMAMMTALVFTGCGKAGNGGENAPAEADDTSVAETGTAGEETSETQSPDLTGFSYLEEYQISDYYGDGKKYELCAPKGGENADGFFYYWEHGVVFTASVFNCGDPEMAEEALRAYFQETVNAETKDWKELYNYSDVGVGETLNQGDDRYLFMTATDKDVFDTPYQRKKLIYMSVRDGGAAVLWDMEVSEIEQDEETTPLIQEVARYYGLNLDELVMEDGIWADQDGKRVMSRQDIYEPKEGEPVLQKVEGYEYLGMMEMAFCLDEENFTCPVLAPMGWDTRAAEDSVSTTIHGVYVQISGDYTSASLNYQGMAQNGADRDFKYRSDPEQENRNVRVSELMPMQGQEAGVYYVVEYEEKERNSDEYHKRADVSFCIQVKEHYFIFGDIYLKSEDYDGATNDLIRELETAYGLDLSAWYADDEAQ